MAGSKTVVGTDAASRVGTPWTLLYVVAVATLLTAFLGVDRAVVVAIVAINLVFVVYLIRHLAFASAAAKWANTDLNGAADVEVGYTPGVTVLVACHNEALVADSLVAGLLALDYPRSRLEVVLVDDASTDGTGEMLDRLTAGHPHVRILRRPAGAGSGKPGALNDGLKLVGGEVVVVFDADHIPHPDVIRRLARHFQDPRVSAVQGRCVVRNWEESMLSRAVAIDYLSGYLVNEYGRQALFELPAYGGANCAVRTSTLRRMGGWNVDSVTEDTDLTLRIILVGDKVRYDVTAVDTEQAPTTFRRFWGQRYRWARGHQQAWRDYRAATWRSKHLGFWEKLETTLFLLVYHVPVLSFATFILLGLRLAGLGHPVTLFQLLPLAALLFAGPFCELGAGLVLSGAPRRTAWAVAWMLPVFMVFMVVCTRAWLDGVFGKPYSWVKTQRSAAVPDMERVAA